MVGYDGKHILWPNTGMEPKSGSGIEGNGMLFQTSEFICENSGISLQFSKVPKCMAKVEIFNPLTMVELWIFKGSWR